MNAPGTPVRFSITRSISSCPTLNELQHEPKLRDECGEVTRVTGEGDEDITSHVIDRARRATDPSGMTNGPYARISVLRPHDGDTVDFEAGYIRHLDWHRQNKDTWKWYGWTVWTGERQRCRVYATFGHGAASLDNPVDPAGDERDNIANVTPHGHFAGHSLFEFLPALSRGNGVPSPAARIELTTVDLLPGAEKSFEAALSATQSQLQNETLWFRLIAGGPLPRYVCLRPGANLASLLADENVVPNDVHKITVEILNLRPAMCYGVAQ